MTNSSKRAVVWLYQALLTFFLVIVPAQRQQTVTMAPPQRTAPLDEEHERAHHEHRIGDKRELEQRPLPERSRQVALSLRAAPTASGFRTIVDLRSLLPRWGHSERRLC